MAWHVEYGSNFRIHGHALPHSGTVAGINLQTVFLNRDVLLQCTLGSAQTPHGFLSRLKFILQELDRIADLMNFTDQALRVKKNNVNNLRK